MHAPGTVDGRDGPLAQWEARIATEMSNLNGRPFGASGGGGPTHDQQARDDLQRRAGAEGLERTDGAGRDYALSARVQFLNACLDRAWRMLPEITKPRDLAYFAMAAAVLIEKRRLEDGLATGRTEVRVTRSTIRGGRTLPGLWS